jgi:UBX domain-containing protein 1
LSFLAKYRDGFTVDDGPFRRLDDPANGEFLRSLARGQTPREFYSTAATTTAADNHATNNSSSSSSNMNIVVGLVDKRHEEYVETFRVFSGAGNTLSSSSTTTTTDPHQPQQQAGIFHLSSSSSTPPEIDSLQPTATIQLRLLNGQRRVITINHHQTVADLVSHAIHQSTTNNNDTSTSSSSSSSALLLFQLMAGYPPSPLLDPTATIQQAGLINAQVSMKKV